MGGGDEYDDDYDYLPPALAAAAASSELGPAIPFGLGGKEAATTKMEEVEGYEEAGVIGSDGQCPRSGLGEGR